MSEASDDAQLPAQDEVVPPARLDAAPDADDVEVLAHAPEPEPEPPRHDSVLPTSRKLAPPPKPKRDSNQPASMPPPGSDGAPSVGSLKSPSAPSISFQEASSASRDSVAAALAGSDPLLRIGEALAKDAGAFSTTEAATGARPGVPRPRSQPASNASPDASSPPATHPSAALLERSPSEPPRARDKVPTVPDEAPAAKPAKSASIFAQRIIAVGTHSERPPPVSNSSPPPSRLKSTPPPKPIREPDITVEVAPEPPPSKPPSVPPLPAVIAVGIAAVDVPFDDDAPHHIPITTDFDDETPTRPSASPAPLPTPEPPALVVPPPPIPSEPTPAPPLAAVDAAARAEAPVDAAARAEAPPPDDVGPDSADRLQVEELSREESPSLPPEELTPAMPPPAPSARPEAKVEAKAEAKPQPPPPPKRPPAAEPAAAPPVEAPAASEGEKKKTKQKRAWWEELFGEDFVRANWKVTDDQIKKEVTFVEESLGVAPGGVVLDLGCGSGQHAVELASRGYGVVGYDLSLYQLALAADNAQERSQKINFLQGDMREMAFEEMFDGIFCWNTSFGYFEEDKNFSVAERAFRALRPGGMFLVDVINRDFVAAHTPSSVWFEGDSCVCMDDAVIDYFTSRLRVKRSVILDDGRTRECTYSIRLYSFHELGKLLHEVGFRVTEVSGHPATPGVFLGQASPRILMLAQRP